VDVLTQTRNTLDDVALRATEGKKSGGFFGIGAKSEPPPPTPTLQKEAKVAVANAVKAYNAYVDINNVGIPFEIQPLPSI